MSVSLNPDRPVVYQGMDTPWGRAQSAEVIIPGVGVVSTAGHGGIKLSQARQFELPDYMRREGGWYEEDLRLGHCVLRP